MTYLIDIDDCIYKSKKLLVKYLNKIYNKNVNYKDIQKYDCICNFPNTNSMEVKDIFEDEDFYNEIELFEDAKQIVNNLINENQVIFITKGTPINIYYKSIRANKDFPNIPIIGISHQLSKGLVDVNDYVVVIDDVADNLYNIGANKRVLFCPDGETEYNRKAMKDNEIINITNWKELNK